MSFDRDLARDTVNYGVGQILPKVIGFLLIPVYVVYLTPAEFGLIELVTSIGMFLTTGMRFSLPGAITRFYFDFKDADGVSRYISTIYFSVIAISLLMTCVFIVIFFLFGEELIPEVSFYPLFTIVLISSLLSASSEVQKKLLQVRRQSAYNAYLNFATALVGVLVTILLVVVFRIGVEGAILSILATATVFFIQAQYYLRKDIRIYFNGKFLLESMSYSMPLFIYQFLGSFSPMISRTLLAEEVSLVSLGVFSMAFKLSQPLTIFSTALASAYTPLYYKLRSDGDSAHSIEQVKRSFGKIWAITMVLFLAVFIFSKPVLFFLPDKTYLQGDLVLKILAFGSLPAMFYSIISHEIFFQKKTGIALFMNLLSVALMIFFSLILVKPLKEVGIALSTILPALVNALIVYLFASRYHAIVIDWQFFFKSLLVSVVAGYLVIFQLDTMTYPTMILLVLLYLLCVGLILVWEQSLMRAGLEFLQKVFHKR